MTASNLAFAKLLRDYVDCGANFLAEFPDYPGVPARFIPEPQAETLELQALLQKIDTEGVDVDKRTALINRYKRKPPYISKGGRFTAPPQTGGTEAPRRFMPPPPNAPNPIFSPATAPAPFANFSQALEKARHLAQTADNVAALDMNMRSFTDHPLLKTAQNPVFFTGSPQAKILIIGEGPGAEEDRAGEPFVGPSGKLLDLALSALGLDRRSDNPENSVLITNVLFYRPPGNRKPTAEETALCEPFVRRLIHLAAPEKILILGGAAARVLAPEEKDGIMRLRGRKITVQNEGVSYSAYPALHPAYLLRTPPAKKYFWFDLLNMRYGLAESKS